MTEFFVRSRQLTIKDEIKNILFLVLVTSKGLPEKTFRH